MTQEEAEVKANEFHGYGPNIYLGNNAEWKKLLGENGRGLYIMIVGMRRKEVAVPTSVKMLHG